jgi:hypothetical protein
MYLVSKHEGLDARRVAVTKQPSGMGLDAATAMKVEKIEVHGSSYKDPGPDFCRFVATDAEGHEVAVRTTEGY